MTFWEFLRVQGDRVAAGCVAVLGGLALLVGWLGVSHELYTAEQIPYVVSGGLGGIFLLGVAATLWLSADLRDEWRKLDELQDVFRAGGESVRTIEGSGSDQSLGTEAHSVTAPHSVT